MYWVTFCYSWMRGLSLGNLSWHCNVQIILHIILVFQPRWACLQHSFDNLCGVIMSWVLADNDAGLATTNNRLEWSGKLGMVRLPSFYQNYHWIWCHVSYSLKPHNMKISDQDVIWIFPLISNELWWTETPLISSETLAATLQFHEASIEHDWWLVLGSRTPTEWS